MIKKKVTKKAIKSRFSNIYNVGYCNIQSLLRYCEPFAYSSGAYGWSCDYYEFGGGVVLSSGYSCIGQKVDYETLKKWDDKALEVLKNKTDYNTTKEILNELIYDFIESLDVNAYNGIMAI